MVTLRLPFIGRGVWRVAQYSWHIWIPPFIIYVNCFLAIILTDLIRACLFSCFRHKRLHEWKAVNNFHILQLGMI